RPSRAESQRRLAAKVAGRLEERRGRLEVLRAYEAEDLRLRMEQAGGDASPSGGRRRLMGGGQVEARGVGASPGRERRALRAAGASRVRKWRAVGVEGGVEPMREG